jgi:squalene monooxygenase
MNETPDCSCSHPSSEGSAAPASTGHSGESVPAFDAVVVGGGVAGSTTAVALGKRGFKVLLCEAGLPSTKRLAGELLHPPGTGSLDELGLLDALKQAGGIPSYGFAVFRDAKDPGTILSYSEIPGGRPAGIALEHGLLTRALFDVAAKHPNVTVWDDTRVISTDLDGEMPMIAVRRGSVMGHARARLVVSAEGRGSKLREQVGIDSIEEPPFRVAGWKLEGVRLPYPGYGHVFVGGPTPTLAYQMSPTAVRIMFELHGDDTELRPELFAALPEPFRTQVIDGMQHSPRQTAKFHGFRPDRVASGNVAVVGDAGGCVHPLIASGMSFCISDGVRLAESLGSPSADLAAGLRRYDQRRKGPMRTRAALGPAMVEALCSTDPSMQLLRHGLFRYWNQSPRGRGVSMGLLSTREDSMIVMAREYALVCAHAATGIATGAVPRRDVVPAVRGLVSRTADLVRGAFAV